eukprot:TRINITY_DN14945_c0_g1_i1.p1 TRINITY_DN14945_c0_g1~~TRINITY_DN14945_c0_g1_i1.p1  ORF type:complete len:782 (+),score=184.27 TRINITY_DN14945_c0_g1_i1:2209-4554(+)
MSGSDTDSFEEPENGGANNNNKSMNLKVKLPSKPPTKPGAARRVNNNNSVAAAAPPPPAGEDDVDYVDDFDDADEEEEAIARARLMSRRASAGSASSAKSSGSSVVAAPKVVLQIDQQPPAKSNSSVIVVDPNAPGKNVNVKLLNTTDSNATDGAVDDETYALGAKVHNQIRQQLSKAAQVVVAIQQLQKQFSLKSQAVEPILPFFDQLAVSRFEVNHNLLLGLREVLLENIEKYSPNKLQALLEKSFRYIAVEEIRPIPVALLLRLPKIPEAYLEQLALNPNLVGELPLKIKQQVWEVNSKVFRDYIKSVCENYATDPQRWSLYGKVFAKASDITEYFENIANSSTVETSSNVAVASKFRNRREGDQTLKTLVECIGNSEQLYQATAATLRDLFGQTQNFGYAILRLEVMMSLHDEAKREIIERDVCYKYAWCLDACINDNRMEQRRIDELKSLYNKIKEGFRDQDHAVISDFAMITSHPLMINLLLVEILKEMNCIIEREELPKDSEHLKFLCSLLTLACSAYRVVRDAKARIPKASTNILRVFFPLLAEVMLLVKIGSDFSGEELASKMEETFLQDKSNVCQTILSYYILECIKSHDVASVTHLITLLPKVEIAQPIKPRPLSWLHRFLHSLVDELSNPEVRDHVISNSLPSPILEICVKRCFLPLARKSCLAHQEFLRLIVHLSFAVTSLASDSSKFAITFLNGQTIPLAQVLSNSSAFVSMSLPKLKLLLTKAAQEVVAELGRSGARLEEGSSDSTSPFGKYVTSEIKTLTGFLTP